MRILIIEDNPGDVRLVQEMLRQTADNFTFDVAEMLGPGLDLLASENVDVVLLDLSLPDSLGLKTLMRLQKQFPRLPVVIMTSIDDEALGIQAVQLGAQDYLVKGQTDGRFLRRALEYAVERKKTEEALMLKDEELSRRNFELETLNKELEAFSYTVSHDLRAPLRHIEGFTEAVLEDHSGQLDEAGRAYLCRIKAASLRMKELIEAIFNMSRLTSGDLSEGTARLSDMVRTRANELQQHEPGRKVEFVLADGVKVSGDADMLQIVINNLLDNAWKFTSRHATARIEFGTINCGLQNADCGINKSEIVNPKSAIVYFVKDDGAGFDMTYAGRLFMPFSRFHSTSEFPGTGIGLATVNRIIRRHGGRLWAESAPEKGATFYFTLSETTTSAQESPVLRGERQA